jgi:hypothetical protein
MKKQPAATSKSATASRAAPPVSVATLDALLVHLVAHWHDFEVEHSEEGLKGRLCDLHRYNFLLWHEEDIARSPAVSDGRIAQVKRAIDRYNQARNDAIEKVDDWLIADLAAGTITAASDAPAATETPGAALDRLSILELRRFHMREQVERRDAAADHRDRAAGKLAILDQQREHLVAALDRLLAEIYSGERPLRVFRQMKMYNDPAMNPHLYRAKKPGAAAAA